MGLPYMDALAVLATLLASSVVYYLSSKRPITPLPPGPKKLPILGNLFNFPRNDPHIAYMNWSRQIGAALIFFLVVRDADDSSIGSDILHLAIPGRTIIVLDSVTAATDLLEKRSSIYSSR